MVTLLFNPDGKVKVPSQAELEAIDRHTFIIAYTNGTMADGRPYYAYIAVQPSKYQEFHDMTAAGKPLVMSHYGQVIIADFAVRPPQDIVDYMREEYGFEDNLESGLQQQLTLQRGAFIQQNEVSRLQYIASMMKQNNYQDDLKAQLANNKEPAAQNGNGHPEDQRLQDIVAMMKQNKA